MVEPFLIVGLALIAATWLTEKFKLIGTLTLITVGVLISLVPGLEVPSVSPHLVLEIFLPVLLYWEALNISLRGIKQALRGVILNGTLMVIWVAVATGLLGQAMGLTLGTALLIGAAIGPTDATAVAALGKGINRRQMVVLRAESLINDGTALVIFALAVEYAGENISITPGRVLTGFLISFVGGTAVGLAVGWVVARLGKHVENPMIGNLFRLTVPFLAFFLAEEIEASGVLAVVVCGLYMAQVGPRFNTVGSRVVARFFFGMLSYILNNLLFLLVGFHLVGTIRSLNSDSLIHAVMVTLGLYLVMFFARWVFVEVMIRVIRLLDRRPSQKLRRTSFWERAVSTAAGFRGAISLAVAFSIPETLSDGMPFPYRDLIIFVTAGIVILSLIVQGVLLPIFVRLANKYPAPHRVNDPDEDAKEIRGAMIDSVQDIYSRLPEIAAQHNISESAVQSAIEEIREQKKTWLKTTADNFDKKLAEEQQASQNLRLAVIRESRANYIRYRDEGKIDDEALIYLLELTDLEEIRITGPIEME